jgi:hypothetical protein
MGKATLHRKEKEMISCRVRMKTAPKPAGTGILKVEAAAAICCLLVHSAKGILSDTVAVISTFSRRSLGSSE